MVVPSLEDPEVVKSTISIGVISMIWVGRPGSEAEGATGGAEVVESVGVFCELSCLDVNMIVVLS